MKKIILLSFITIIMLSGIVLAEQPKLTSNTIYLNPFYNNNLFEDEEYNFTLNVLPPDGISEVISAMIKFDVYVSPTSNFNLTINGEACTPPIFEVHTSYANAHFASIAYDCSNVITKAGIYNVKMITDDDTGAAYGWLDLTYINRPTDADVIVHGTEYVAGDNGKTFIQLLNSNYRPINNSECYCSIYYPDDSVYKYKQSMTYVDEGLYRYNFDIPYTAGVYMVSAYCVVPEINTTTKEVTDNFETATISGGTNWQSNWILDGASFTNTFAHRGTYSLLMEGSENPYRIFNGTINDNYIDISFWYRLTGVSVSEYFYVYLEDSNGVDYLLKSVTTPEADGIWRQSTITLYREIDDINLTGNLTFKVLDSNNLEPIDLFYIDDIEITLNSELEVNGTQYQEIRGSGEVHVSSANGYEYEITNGSLYNNTFLDGFDLYFNVISQSYQNIENVEVTLPLWKPFPCEHIINVQLFNGTEWINISYNTKTNGYCQVSFYLEMDAYETYQIRIINENYWKQKLLSGYSNVQFYNDFIDIACYNYQIANNLSNYTIPLHSPSNTYPDDNFYKACENYLSSEYLYNNHIENNFLPIININTTFSYEQMLELESMYLHIEETRLELIEYGNSIITGLLAGDAYSLAILEDPYPPTNPYYTKYFSSLSSSYLQYVKTLNLTNETWNFPNRNLTYYEDVTNYTKINSGVWNYTNRTLTNATNIAPDIWGYNYTINPGMLGQIVAGVWDYVARYTHGIIN